MRVAIDSGPLSSGHSVRGIGVTTRELLREFEERPPKDIQIFAVDFSRSNLAKYDLAHYQSFRPYFRDLPLSKPTKKLVITIHDLIPLIYPEHYPPGIRGWLNWQLNRRIIKSEVNAIITISETSKKDICRFLGVDPEKVFVVYLAPQRMFKKITNTSVLHLTAKKYKLPSRFALYIGDVNYNKNIPNLVEACRTAKIPLVIAGKQAAEIENSGLNHPELTHLKNVDWSGVVRLGYVSEYDLSMIMNLASVYIQPSFYEGFGLPLLEAYACGTPIAVAKNQCHVEILGDEFEYFDPKDTKGMSDKILNPNKGRKLPRQYSWGQTAKDTLSVYGKV